MSKTPHSVKVKPTDKKPVKRPSTIGSKLSKTFAVSMRLRPSQGALLTKAAKILRKDRTAFILDVACREAENVLLDQRFFHLDGDDFNAFETALAAPLPDNKRLKALLAESAPWEQ